MAAARILHMAWVEDDQELIGPLTRGLEAMQDDLGFELRATRHPLGFGLPVAGELEDAEVILLMVSPAFLSVRSARSQVEAAHERALKGATVISILVRSGGDLRSMPRDLVPTLPSTGSIADAPDKDAVYAEVLDELRAAIGHRRDVSPPSPPPPPSKAAPAPPGEGPRISPSTTAAVRGLSSEVDASAIVRGLLRLHPEYGNEAGGKLEIEPTATKQAVAAWLAQVRELYDEHEVDVLHGRHVIRGLAMLDPDLRKPLSRHDFLAALEEELEPPLSRALSPQGWERWEPNKVRTLPDRPAEDDELERDAFAQGLAEMIEEERSDSIARLGHAESFLVHLHGPWGSGKTSLLGFLRKALHGSQEPWVVVEFNAWQHERLGAPWWSLMTAVHREGLRAPFGPNHAKGSERWRDLWRAVRLLWFDVAWRVRLGWMAYLVLPIVLGLLYFGWKQGFFDSPETAEGLARAGDLAKPIGAIIGLIVTLLGAARGLGRSLSVGSARGAETFMRTSRDPMRTLRRRYEKLIATIGRPVAVFIDDMDRCQSDYVVEVLQGVQTLLIDAPVTYVVAADRRWLYDSYAKVYADFRSVAREPGRPLGHLFLEKTFQLSASLPALPGDVVDLYWDRLTGPGGDDAAEDATIARARERVSGAGLDELISDPSGGTAAEQRAERVARSAQIAAPQVRREIENRLKPFSRLLEPNPRAMKRLINAYQIELRRLLAEGRRVGRASVTPEEIALWTILSLRWPLLADQLAQHPERVEDASVDWLPSSLKPLWASDDVRRVVEGDEVPALLTERSVRALVGRAARRDTAPAPSEGNGAGAVPSVA